MRTATQALQDLLATAGQAWRASLYTITLASGKVFYWTDSDHDLTVSGATYVSGGGANALAPIVKRSGMRSNLGLQIDTLDVELIGPWSIGGKPLAQLGSTGYFDGATVRVDLLFGAYPGDVTLSPVENWFVGCVADCQPNGRNLKLRVKSNLEKLNVQLPRFLLQPSCGNAFCDANCGLSRVDYTQRGACSTGSTVSVVKSTSVDVVAKSTGYYDHGYIHFAPYTATLELRDVKVAVSTHTLAAGVATFNLAMPLKVAPALNERFAIYGGCARTKAACLAKDNLANWRGFPHVPSTETASVPPKNESAQGFDVLAFAKALAGIHTPKVYGAALEPGTYCGNANPLPIAYGRVRLPMYLIEAAAPALTSYPERAALTTYYIGDRVSFRWGIQSNPLKYVYECSTSGTTQAGYLGANKQDTINDGGCVWTFVQSLPMPVYTQTMAGALCEGEVGDATRVFFDKETAYANTGTLLPHGFRLQKGWDSAATQTASISTCGISESYQHTACLTPQGTTARELIYTGTDNTLPNIALELHAVRPGQSASESTSTLPDINPVDIIYDLLTHNRRGAGWSESLVDVGSGVGSLRAYCDAAGLRMSLVVDKRQTALSIIGAVLGACNGTAVWSQGKIKLLTNADGYITTSDAVYGDGYYQPANMTAVYNLTNDDFLGEIEIERTSFSDTYNTIPVEFTLRGSESTYQRVTIEAHEPIDVAQHGIRRSDTVSLPVIFGSQEPATLLSRVFAQKSLYSRNLYRVRLSWKGALVEPGDVLTLTCPGVIDDLTSVRVVEFQEEKDGFTLTAIDWPNGVAAATTYEAQGNDGFVPNQAKITSMLRTNVDGAMFGVSLPVLSATVTADTSLLSGDSRKPLKFLTVDNPDGYDLTLDYPTQTENVYVAEDGLYTVNWVWSMANGSTTDGCDFQIFVLRNGTDPLARAEKLNFKSADGKQTLAVVASAVKMSAGEYFQLYWAFRYGSGWTLYKDTSRVVIQRVV